MNEKPEPLVTRMRTPLALAAQRNDLVWATDLLRQGTDVNQKDALGFPPLLIAAGLGNAQMVELLLTAGADVLLLDSRMGTSALHKAAQSGVVDVARLLMQHGAFLDLQAPTHGYTPLINAVWYKHAGMVAYLVAAGAILSLRTHQGETALDFARHDGLTEIIAILEEGERAVAAKAASQALLAAVKQQDVNRVRTLLQQGVDVNEKTAITGGPDDGHTALLIAAREGNEEIVWVLLAAGANPRIVDWPMKATPGHMAAYMGHAAVAKLLVEQGNLELNAQGPYNGYTALHDGTWHGHSEAVKVLIDAGARLDLQGHDGFTPLDLAKAYGYHEIVSLLEEKK